MFQIKNLFVSIADSGEERLKKINMEIKAGELHIVMGPNGSGKSTLAHSIAGSPRYNITKGKLLFEGEEIQSLKPEERARKGIFIGFQTPPEIPMVNYYNFLRIMLEVNGKDIDDNRIKGTFERCGLPPEFLEREVNKGFSGGERKRAEMAQLLLLNPKLAILDEPDTGVDVDSIKYITGTINDILSRNASVLLITHSTKILENVPENFTVHVLIDGQIKAKSGPELVKKIEEEGFGS